VVGKACGHRPREPNGSNRRSVEGPVLNGAAGNCRQTAFGRSQGPQGARHSPRARKRQHSCRRQAARALSTWSSMASLAQKRISAPGRRTVAKPAAGLALHDPGDDIVAAGSQPDSGASERQETLRPRKRGRLDEECVRSLTSENGGHHEIVKVGLRSEFPAGWRTFWEKILGWTSGRFSVFERASADRGDRRSARPDRGSRARLRGRTLLRGLQEKATVWIARAGNLNPSDRPPASPRPYESGRCIVRTGRQRMGHFVTPVFECDHYNGCEHGFDRKSYQPA